MTFLKRIGCFLRFYFDNVTFSAAVNNGIDEIPETLHHLLHAAGEGLIQIAISQISY